MEENLDVWGIGEDVQSEESSSKMMDVSIEAGRFITKLEFIDEENQALSVEVTDNDGRMASRRYFAPKIDDVYIKDKEKLSAEIKKFKAVLANIARKFIPNYTIVSTEARPLTTFKSVCMAVIDDINSTVGEAYKTKELRVKTVYNSKGFVTLPGAAPICEDPTVVAEKDSKLVYNRWDTTEMPKQKPDAEQKPTTSEEDW